MSNFIIFAAKDEDAIRHYNETEHEYRTKFERDRDRIIFCKEFRRLSGKTQVFVAGYDDNIRTRLTHTLEVAQIAKTIARHLNLNDILTEGIALGHDIGHTPFGHVGERTLNLIANGCDALKNINDFIPPDQQGFKHNWQSLRVATKLERIDRSFPGLNLTDYTLWGILNHSSLEYKECSYFNESRCTLKHEHNSCKKNTFSLKFYENCNEYLRKESWTIEGLVVNWADEIAQRNHDLQDGIVSKIVDKNELTQILKETFGSFLTEAETKQLETIKAETIQSYYIAQISRFITNIYVSRLLENTKNNMRLIKDKYQLSSSNNFYNNKDAIRIEREIPQIVSYQSEFENKEKEFHLFLKGRIINSGQAQRMDGKSNYIILQLVKAFLTNPQQLPDSTIISIYRNSSNFDLDKALEKIPLSEVTAQKRNELQRDYHNHKLEGFKIALLRTICDYIAGMTDQYALDQYEMLYGGTRFRNT